MSDPSPKVIQIRSTAKTIQLVPFWPDNAETWFQIAESDFCEHGITDQRSQFLAVIHALPREFSRCVTLQMSVSNSYELLKASILKKNVLTDRQRLDELFRNIELGDQSAVSMLARMKEIIGQSQFDEGLFRELFLSKLPQSVQTVLVTLQGVLIDDLAVSADRILEITKRPVTEVYSVTEQTSKKDSAMIELINSVQQMLRSNKPGNSSYRRSKSPQRQNARGRSKSNTRSVKNPDWCWYHNTYGKEAKCCRKPCDFGKASKSVENYPAGTR
ncbi:unnamed protein product [Trichobilharzia szidati]|nr:unnamed protein product [Trichobilharzia szidati]